MWLRGLLGIAHKSMTVTVHACYPLQARVESRKKRPGITQDIYSETTYYIRNGVLTKCEHAA